MTLGKGKILQIGRVGTRLPLENSLCKMLWISHKADYRMNDLTVELHVLI